MVTHALNELALLYFSSFCLMMLCHTKMISVAYLLFPGVGLVLPELVQWQSFTEDRNTEDNNTEYNTHFY